MTWDIECYSQYIVPARIPKLNRWTRIWQEITACKEKQIEVSDKIPTLKASILEVGHTIRWVSRIMEQRRTLIDERPCYESYYRQLVKNSEDELVNKKLALKNMRSRLRRYKKYTKTLSRRINNLEMEQLLIRSTPSTQLASELAPATKENVAKLRISTLGL